MKTGKMKKNTGSGLSGARKYFNGKASRRKKKIIKIVKGDFFSVMLLKRKHI